MSTCISVHVVHITIISNDWCSMIRARIQFGCSVCCQWEKLEERSESVCVGVSPSLVHVHFYLLCSDLSGIKDLQLVILNTFSSQSEEVRSAASYALGIVCVCVCLSTSICLSLFSDTHTCTCMCLVLIHTLYLHRECQCWQLAEVSPVHSL